MIEEKWFASATLCNIVHCKAHSRLKFLTFFFVPWPVGWLIPRTRGEKSILHQLHVLRKGLSVLQFCERRASIFFKRRQTEFFFAITYFQLRLTPKFFMCSLYLLHVFFSFETLIINFFKNKSNFHTRWKTRFFLIKDFLLNFIEIIQKQNSSSSLRATCRSNLLLFTTL